MSQSQANLHNEFGNFHNNYLESLTNDGLCLNDLVKLFYRFYKVSA